MLSFDTLINEDILIASPLKFMPTSERKALDTQAAESNGQFIMRTSHLTVSRGA